ncbi:MAG: hypothetical protein ACOC5B_00245, partial [Myxococcota bacterium]
MTQQRIERARQAEARRMQRRSFLRVSIFAGLTLTVGAMAAGFLNFFNLRNPTGFGGTITLTPDRVPEKG